MLRQWLRLQTLPGSTWGAGVRDRCPPALLTATFLPTRDPSRDRCCLLQELLRDPLYIGLKHRRVRGQEYDDLLDEFMQAVTDK